MKVDNWIGSCKTSTMQKDWGYAAFVEYGGKRILFDTGNNPDILAQNAKAKGVDLTKLDFVVMSHRHGDHMGGLTYVLKLNPTVKIYAPEEGRGGVYGAEVMAKSSDRTWLTRLPETWVLGSTCPAAIIGQVSTKTHFSGNPTNQDLANPMR